MVDCANSSCRKDFRFLNGGDLYALERESRHSVLLDLLKVFPFSCFRTWL